MNLEVIYEDNDILAVNKPAGIIVFVENKNNDGAQIQTVISFLLKKYPNLKNIGDSPRYGIVHRLDKDTSGILLIAKSNESLIFLQKQFKNREVEKKYIALVTGIIKEDFGEIKTLIARSSSDPRKQKSYKLNEGAPESARESLTQYRVLERFIDYTLLQAQIKTGRKHQIRCHMAYIHHPIAGDKLYGFKDSFVPQGLQRQFLHASYIKIKLPNGYVAEFSSDLPNELATILDNLKIKDQNEK